MTIITPMSRPQKLYDKMSKNEEAIDYKHLIAEKESRVVVKSVSVGWCCCVVVSLLAAGAALYQLTYLYTVAAHVAAPVLHWYRYFIQSNITHGHKMATHYQFSDIQPDKVVSCYYNFPTKASQSHKDLLPLNIHPKLCSHINVAFARIVNKEIHLEEHEYKTLRDIVQLKQKNPNLKILLSIGGANNDSGFSDMVVDHKSRKTFIRSIKAILRNYTLDGIDLDWEFPALHVTRKGDRERQHFSQLLREIRMEYIREKRDYLLTAATAAPETIVSISYDIDQLNQYLDYVNIMTYDFHSFTKYTPFTGFNSPLYAKSSEVLYLATLNINYTVHMYLEKGLDRNKIVVGIPTYGHTFSLMNANNPRVGSPAAGFGALGSLGFVNYPDVCTFQKSFSDATVKRDEEARVPYMYRGEEWVSFDSPQSVMEKAKFIKEHDLRGAMIYSLNADDFRGVCAAGAAAPDRFPLATSARDALLPARR